MCQTGSEAFGTASEAMLHPRHHLLLHGALHFCITTPVLSFAGCLLIWCPAYGKRATMKCLSEDHTPLLCKDSKTSAVWASGANGILFNMPFVSRGPFLLKFVLMGNLSVKLAYVHTACNSVKQQHFSFNMLLIPVTIENMQFAVLAQLPHCIFWSESVLNDVINLWVKKCQFQILFICPGLYFPKHML